MGNWHISIQGVGVHHNYASNLAEDADKMAAEFVELLKSKGHNVVLATVTHGGMSDIKDGQKYLADRAAIAADYKAKSGG